MNTTYLGHRPRKTYDTHNFSATLQLARTEWQRAHYLEVFDIYEQLVEAYPAQSIALLAEVYDCYQQLPQKDRYTLYQSRFFDFRIQPTDKVLDIGSGHVPFPVVIHLANMTLDNHQYGRGRMF